MLGISRLDLVKNVGNVTAADLDVNILTEGGLIIFSGEYEVPDNVSAGEEVEILMSVFGIGVGIFTPMPEIKVTAECAEGPSTEHNETARILFSSVKLLE